EGPRWLFENKLWVLSGELRGRSRRVVPPPVRLPAGHVGEILHDPIRRYDVRTDRDKPMIRLKLRRHMRFRVAGIQDHKHLFSGSNERSNVVDHVRGSRTSFNERDAPSQFVVFYRHPVMRADLDINSD